VNVPSGAATSKKMLQDVHSGVGVFVYCVATSIPPVAFIPLNCVKDFKVIGSYPSLSSSPLAKQHFLSHSLP
jgi:hypothetical protein